MVDYTGEMGHPDHRHDFIQFPGQAKKGTLIEGQVDLFLHQEVQGIQDQV